MRPAARVVLIAASVAMALAVLLWPRHAPPSAEVAQPPAPAHEAGVAADASRAGAPTPLRADDAPPGPVDDSTASEADLMDAAAASLTRDPARTLALIEAADRRFGAQSEGRRVLEIEALVKLERIGLSHAKAERFYHAFPKSPASRRIEQLTGYHPRPWGPGDPDE